MPIFFFFLEFCKIFTFLQPRPRPPPCDSGPGIFSSHRLSLFEKNLALRGSAYSLYSLVILWMDYKCRHLLGLTACTSQWTTRVLLSALGSLLNSKKKKCVLLYFFFKFLRWTSLLKHSLELGWTDVYFISESESVSCLLLFLRAWVHTRCSANSQELCCGFGTASKSQSVHANWLRNVC